MNSVLPKIHDSLNIPVHDMCVHAFLQNQSSTKLGAPLYILICRSRKLKIIKKKKKKKKKNRHALLFMMAPVTAGARNPGIVANVLDMPVKVPAKFGANS